MTHTGTSLRLVVVGTGALGSALLQRLAVAGMRSVLLVDPDVVEPHNLPLSPFLQQALAAHAAQATEYPRKAALLAVHAWTTYRLPWRALSCDVASVGWQRLRACDLLCCCTDSSLSRAEVAFIARSLGKPVLDGAVAGGGIAEGRVTRFSPHPAAACYLCGMGEERRAAVLGLAASAALGCRMLEEPPAMTGTRAALDLVADTMATAIHDVAAGDICSDFSYAVKLHASRPQRAAETVQLVQSGGCPWHDAAVPKLCDLPWELPLRDALPRLYPGHELLLNWPVCTEAVCISCRQRCSPFQRVAVVRRTLRCPHCGTRTLQPLSSVSRVRAADPLALRSPRQLGQPIRHLYRLCAAAG